MRLAITTAMAALTSLPASAATFEETKILPDMPTDGFGTSVAISGSTAIVGANFVNVDGVSAVGAAYLFDVATGQQTRTLTAEDGAQSDLFGRAVAISGTTAIVGSSFDDDNGSRSGSAYLFDTTTGEQTAKLLAEDGEQGDQFGSSVAISGSTAVVGAFANNDNGFLSGSAYLFDTTTGEQTAKLVAGDTAERDTFGVSVAVSGTTAIVGASGNQDSRGAAYLFDTTTGERISKLTAEDAAPADAFGGSVAISGTTAIVGSSLDDDKGRNSGSAYLFDTTTGEQIGKLTAQDGAGNDVFGRSVAISGTTVIVGADQDDDGGTSSGSAYLFDLTTGEQIAKLTADDAARLDAFGVSVAISEMTPLIGAPGDDAAGRDAGAAYIYTPEGTATAPVPLPAGIWLLGTALGGLAAGRRAVGRRACGRQTCGHAA